MLWGLKRVRGYLRGFMPFRHFDHCVHQMKDLAYNTFSLKLVKMYIVAHGARFGGCGDLEVSFRGLCSLGLSISILQAILYILISVKV